MALSFPVTSASLHVSFLLVEEGNGEFSTQFRLKATNGRAALPGESLSGLTAAYLDAVGSVKGLNFRRKQTI